MDDYTNDEIIQILREENSKLRKQLIASKHLEAENEKYRKGIKEAINLYKSNPYPERDNPTVYRIIEILKALEE